MGPLLCVLRGRPVLPLGALRATRQSAVLFIVASAMIVTMVLPANRGAASGECGAYCNTCGIQADTWYVSVWCGDQSWDCERANCISGWDCASCCIERDPCGCCAWEDEQGHEHCQAWDQPALTACCAEGCN